MADAVKNTNLRPITIATHNGQFHADEALAVYMLRLLPTYQHSQLIRTRKPEIISTCHTVVDVGGEYDPVNNRYDHHQRTFDTTFPNCSTKLSSAGLVYLHFGKAIISRHLGISEDSDQVGIVWERLYKSFIEALDANDNGISVYDPKKIAAAGLEKNFQDANFTLGAMVVRLNPNWNDPVPSDPAKAQQFEDELFSTASARIGEEFSRAMNYYSKSWLPARDIIKKTFDERLKHDPEGRILAFEGQFAPWKEHLLDLEDAEGTGPKVLYVLYQDSSTLDTKWRIQCVPEGKGSFQSRKPLPEAWRGYRDEELDRISNISGGVFVHASGFIGGNKTFEGVKEMAIRALNS